MSIRYIFWYLGTYLPVLVSCSKISGNPDHIDDSLRGVFKWLRLQIDHKKMLNLHRFYNKKIFVSLRNGFFSFNGSPFNSRTFGGFLGKYCIVIFILNNCISCKCFGQKYFKHYLSDHIAWTVLCGWYIYSHLKSFFTYMQHNFLCHAYMRHQTTPSNKVWINPGVEFDP
jgi:hypothetical protein